MNERSPYWVATRYWDTAESLPEGLNAASVTVPIWPKERWDKRGRRPATRAERDALPQASPMEIVAKLAWGLPWFHTCLVCDSPFRGRVRYCTDECAREAHLAQQRDRWTKVVVVARACDHCGEEFTPSRKDARFCSTRCRVASHRAG